MKRISQLLLCLFTLFLAAVRPLSAYTTNMDASVVVGQTDFTTNTAGTTKGKFSNVIRGIFVDSQGRLIVSDQNNNRIFVWNTVPTTNGVEPDLVLGQADFTSVAANRGGSIAANTLNLPTAVHSDGTKLFVLDRNNDRVLIWNTFPTTNGQDADIAVGVGNLTSNPVDACNASTLSDPYGMTVYGNKLLVSDRNHNRILIWETIPGTSGAAATKVIAQPDLTTCSAQVISDKSLNDVRGISVDSEGRLIVADRGRQRILIWNTIPTTNFASANLVIGQPDFTSSGVGTAANRIGSILSAYSNGTQLFISDINRVLIFNQFPSSNGASADIVLGQTDFVSNAINAGGDTAANTLGGAHYIHETNNMLFTTDERNARVLIFRNPVPVTDTVASSTPTHVFSEARPELCSLFAPVGSPYVFQALRVKNSVVLFYTPVLNTTNGYFVVYGFQHGDERFGVKTRDFDVSKNLGVQTMMINDLNHEQEYWFKVAAQNNCALGEWSSWLKVPKWQGKPRLIYK